MQFKSREGGIWTFGQKHTIPEPDSRWAVNPASFQWGWICWGDSSKILGEKLVPISQPMPNVTELPDKGFPWQQEMAVNLKCISGADAGKEVDVQDQHRRRHPGHRRTDRGGARSPQWRPARRQGVADRAAGEGLATRTLSTGRPGCRC